jgi:putative transposase
MVWHPKGSVKLTNKSKVIRTYQRWRSVKYEEVYLKAYDNVGHARQSLDTYFRFYNEKRRHQSLDRQSPDSVYYQTAARRAA